MKKLILIGISLLMISTIGYSQSNNLIYNPYSSKKYATVEGIDLSTFNGLTIESWVNLAAYYPNAIYSGSPVFFQEANYSVSNGYGFIIIILSDTNEVGDNKRAAFGLNFGPTGQIHIGLHSNSEIPLNEWHHIAATWDGTYMRIYLDGVFDGELNAAQVVEEYNILHGTNYDPGVIYNPGKPTHILYRGSGAYGYFYGSVDELRIWNVVRSDSDLRQTMYEELTGSEYGLYAYWNLNETGGEYIYDITSTGLNGYLGDSPATTSFNAYRGASSAPVPYFTVQSGSWKTDETWAAQQKVPINNWAKVKLNHDIILDSNVTANDLTISSLGSLTVDDTYTLTVDGNLLLQSDASGSASLIDNGTMVYTSADVEQYITEERWHYMASPVENPTANVFYDIYLRTWDEPTETWSYITNPNAVLSNEMEGYAVWASQFYTGTTTVNYNGTLNSGNYSLSLTNTAGTTSPPGEDPSGYNFVGNPYPSGIDWNSGGWTKTNVDNAIYIITYPGGVRQYGSYVDGTSTNGVTNEIAPHQGFFIKCNNTSGGTLQVTNAARIHTNQTFFKSTEDLNQLIRMNVVGSNGLSDETVVRGKDGATNAFDGEYDALKMKGAQPAPQLYSWFNEDIIYSINTLSVIDENTIVPIAFEAGEDDIYELSFKIKDDLNGLDIYLEDTKEQKLINWKSSGNYKFSGSVDDDPARFILRFSANEVPIPFANTNADAITFVKDNSIVVSLMESNEGYVIIYDLSGRVVFEGNVTKGTNTIPLKESPGYLLVKVITPGSNLTNKVFIK